MDPLDFLDKQHKHQVHIFQFLLQENRRVTVERLLARFSLSTPTIQKEVLQLKERLAVYDEQTDLYLVDKTELVLTLPLQFDLKDFLYTMYYEQSIDIQLLDQLYTFPELSITKLTLELQVSEASLFRRLKRINQLLVDFDIQYKNKQLIGKAQDLQLFYYRFFIQVYPLEKLQKRFYRTSFSQLLTIIHKQLQYDFSEVQEIELMVWLSIMEKQLDVRNNRIFSPLPQKEWAKGEGFKQLEQIFLRFSSRYAVQWPIQSIEWFYIFLQAEGYIPVTKAVQHSFSPLVKDTYHTFNVIEEDPTLTDYMLRLYTYISYQKSLWTVTFTQRERLSDTQEAVFYQLMEQVERYLPKGLNTTKWAYLDQEYARISRFIEYQKERFVTITYHIKMQDRFLQEETIQLLNRYSIRFGIEFIWTTQETADMLITTNKICNLSEKHTSLYLLAQSWTAYHVSQLEELIQLIKTYKEERE